VLPTIRAGATFFALELDQIPNGQAYQAALTDLTGQRTVPNVWINGKFIGGSDKLAALERSGELAKLLQEKESDL